MGLGRCEAQRRHPEPELAKAATAGSAQGLGDKGARPRFASIKSVQED